MPDNQVLEALRLTHAATAEAIRELLDQCDRIEAKLNRPGVQLNSNLRR